MKLFEPRSPLQRFSGITGFLAIVTGIATIAINFESNFWKNSFIFLTVTLWTVFIVSWIVATIKIGILHMKASQANRADEPLMFWFLFGIIICFLSGIYWWIFWASWRSWSS
ncbi:hypothetical protein [Sulfurimicrobium lacus]|uniref:hypothetical protein n=1 Tax=Sulfurimicrobium lacus TaxID=2715678 RepID=UPI0015652AFF|nr:hypothetical protein [Sulfurimicrobium lacus]